MKIGIIGLANVGKSSLFNALTNAGAQSSNYPFTTIEPNIAVAPIPDKRLTKLFEVFKPPGFVPSAIEFVDIAGLVKGASKGEGLGNKFLGHIRDVDALIHLVRIFEDKNIAHPFGDINPIRDIETVETELILADLETVEKMLEKNQKLVKSGEKGAVEKQNILEKIKQGLLSGKPAGILELTPARTKEFRLLTSKPVIYVVNISENEKACNFSEIERFASNKGIEIIRLCAKLEEEISALPSAEKDEFLSGLGIDRTGLDKVVLASKKLLDLIVFFTVNPKVEVRSWLIKNGSTAIDAAGKVHTDFAKGFIKAEIYSYADFEKYSDEKTLRQKGLLRQEGRDYKIKDGDICFFKFSI